MAVEQEMAEVYPPDAEAFAEFLPETDCAACGFKSCIEFAGALLSKTADPKQCPELPADYAELMLKIPELDTSPIPYNIMMEQAPCELIEINRPQKDSPLLITCNFRETVRIMREILEATDTRAFLLPTSTHGYSVDNAVHERMFKAVEIWKAINENRIAEKIGRQIMIIPGLAESERTSIRQLTRWEVMVGPESGFLAPLFIYQNSEEFV
jgi:CO dehydrogenase/acetyl-CoA synthase gamma subunit (corrinoid Fe-S protein)